VLHIATNFLDELTASSNNAVQSAVVVRKTAGSEMLELPLYAASSAMCSSGCKTLRLYVIIIIIISSSSSK